MSDRDPVQQQHMVLWQHGERWACDLPALYGMRQSVSSTSTTSRGSISTSTSTNVADAVGAAIDTRASVAFVPTVAVKCFTAPSSITSWVKVKVPLHSRVWPTGTSSDAEAIVAGVAPVGSRVQLLLQTADPLPQLGTHVTSLKRTLPVLVRFAFRPITVPVGRKHTCTCTSGMLVQQQTVPYLHVSILRSTRPGQPACIKYGYQTLTICADSAMSVSPLKEEVNGLDLSYIRLDRL
jgi:hypothetical protein